MSRSTSSALARLAMKKECPPSTTPSEVWAVQGWGVAFAWRSVAAVEGGFRNRLGSVSEVSPSLAQVLEV